MDGVCSFLIVKLEGAGDRLSLAPCMRCRRPLENVAADNLAMSNVSLPVPSGSRPHCKLIMAGYHAAADADSHKKLAQRAAAVFKSNFGEYQTLTAADYLEHGFLFAALQSFIRSEQKPVQVLDLGCGDSKNVTRLFAEAPDTLAAYTGVDMSASALDQAFESMEEALPPGLPLAFHLADMLSFLKQTTATYDIVLAAFSLHHLTPDEKRQALREIHRLTSRVGGSFVMIDPFRREGEDLDAYHRRATEVGQTWTALGSEQQQKFIDHMQTFDLMEPQSFFEQAAKEAGFASMDVICRGSKGLQACVTVFRH